MTLLFVRATAGEEVFRSLLETEYEKPLRAVRGTAADARLIDMRHNDNNTAVYCKGPVVLDRVASRMGYDAGSGLCAGFTQPGGTGRDLLTRHSSACLPATIRRRRGCWIRLSARSERPIVRTVSADDLRRDNNRIFSLAGFRLTMPITPSAARLSKTGTSRQTKAPKCRKAGASGCRPCLSGKYRRCSVHSRP